MVRRRAFGKAQARMSADRPAQPQPYGHHKTTKALARSAEVLAKDRLTCEYRFAKKDGEYIWVRDELLLVRDAQGQPLEIIGAWADISDRKQAEELIMRQLQTLAALYAGAQKLAQSLDMEEVAREVCRTCVEVFDVRLAWLGRAEEDGRVIPIAQFPTDHPYPRAITVRWDETAEGQGPTGRAIRSGFPQVIADISEDPRFVPWRSHTETYDFRSSMAFPLTSRGRIFGALNLYSDRPGFFTPELMDTFQALAHQAAAALENTRLYDDALRRLRRLQALRNIDLAITGTLQPHHTIGALLEVDAADVLLYDQEAAALVYAAGRGFQGQAIEHTRLRLGEGYAGRAALERRTLSIGDLTQVQDFVRVSLLREEGFATYYVTPLIAKGQVLGVLETFHRGPRPTDGEWLEFLETLAGQIAMAIENVRLYQELEAYAAELEHRVAERTAELSHREAALAAANEELLGRMRR